uniref:Variant surface glycoprotein n=1 Tax=Trypanosoma brucei TaxID=5691 RepID=A0A1V0FYJ1_9TRYP|nr:variant surface glycoprotein [Trypanosoma brucei]
MSHRANRTEAYHTALTAAINSAIYGAGKDASKNLEHTALTGKQPANYATSCGNVGRVKESKTLAHAVACVCGTAQALSNEEPCIHSGTGNVLWEVSGLPLPDKWTTIRAACPKVTPQPLTADRIRSAVGTAATAIVTDGTHAYIGHMKTGCDGNSNTACPRLTNAAQNDGNSLTKVLWLQQLAAVAAKLDQRQKFNIALTKKKENMQTIAWQVKAFNKRSIFLKRIQHCNICDIKWR